MSNDLISRKVLMEEIGKSMSFNPHENPTIARNHTNEHIHFFIMVQEAPTAYDVDAVCKELLSESICAKAGEEIFVKLDRTIDIVRNGGKK